MKGLPLFGIAPEPKRRKKHMKPDADNDVDLNIAPESEVQPEEGKQIFTVSEFIEILNVFFRAKPAKIMGEICELKRAASGHVYFTVKDKEEPGVLDCIIWNRNYELCGVALEVGMEVILSGHPNIYPPSGRLSFVADTVELVGEGALKKAYDALKKKLDAEGLFALERKRPLPEYPQKIGVITSMKGAVIHDFENNLGKFGFTVNVIDSRVEGQQATKPLLAAIRAMRERAFAGEIETLVIIRGGGSLESLQAFNNEMLVRAVASFPVPVIAGIGHDQDVPLMALVADHMTSTPTAAAHLLCESWREAYAKVRAFAGIVGRFPVEMERTRSRLAETGHSLCGTFIMALMEARRTVELGAQALRHNDPARQLQLGYSIARMDGKVVRSVKGMKAGDPVELTVADGTLGTEVREIREIKKDRGKNKDNGENNNEE